MKINQLKAGVVLSYASEFITILTGLIYTPIMLRLLGQSEYGLYQLVASVIAYLSLLSFGFGSSYIRYYSRYKVQNDEKSIARLNGMFMIIFIVIGFICAVAGGILTINIEHIFKKSLTKHEMDTARILMGLMIFNLSISFPGSVFNSHVTANEQYFFQKIVVLLKNLLNPFITLPLLLIGYKSIGVVVVQTILSIASFAANWIFCKKKLRMEFSFKVFDVKLMKSLFMFSFWIFLNQIIDQINWSVDKFVLGVVSGTVAVAVYGVAGQLNSLYLNFSTSISNVFAPRVNRIVAECNDNKILTDLFTKVGRIQFIILALAGSGLIVFGKYFIELWAGKEYGETYRISLLLILPVTVPLIQNIGMEIQRAKNLHKYRSIVYFIIAILNIIVSIPLAKLYGGTGAAIGTAASLLLGNGLIMNIMYHRLIGLDIIYFWKQILKFVPALIIPSVCGVLIMRYIHYNGIILFAVTIMIYIIIYCISMWFLGMNVYEKKLVSEPIKKVISKIKK